MSFTHLTFGDYDPVTGPPTVDGLVSISDAGVITSEAEPGYVNGGRLTFGGGAQFAPVIVDAVRNAGFINLAFFCRFDLSFDRADTIVVALKPAVGSAQTAARRVDIHPVYTGIGADEDNGSGGAAGNPDDAPAGVPAGSDFHIRTNHTPAETTFYEGASSGAWTRLLTSPASVAYKARSWRPPAATATYTTGAQTLNNGGTLNVLNTATFPAAGLFEVAGTVVKYTSKTGTSFAGCTGASGPLAGLAVPDNAAVRIPECAWSAELQIPISSTWIDLDPTFGLFIGVLRAGITPASGPLGPGGNYVAQYLFPTASGPLTGILDETLTISSYGEGRIPAEGAIPGLGVRVRGGELGVGARLTTDAAWSTIGNQISRTADTRFVTQVENTDPANPATGVTAEIRLANWGLPTTDFAAWAKAPGAAPNPSNAQNVVNGTDVELTTDWPLAQVPPEYRTHWHQCMWVQLDSGSSVNFVRSSERRNMDFEHLSEASRDAEISGSGYPSPPSGNDHDFVLITNSRAIQVRGRGDSDGDSSPSEEPTLMTHARGQGTHTVFLWIVHGFRRTDDYLTIGDNKYEVVDPSPDAFGLIATHDGEPGDVLTSALDGGDIESDGPVSHLRVPDGGSVTIQTSLKAAPAEKAKEDDGGGGPDDTKGCLPAILAVLAAIVAAIRRLFKK